MSVAAFARAWQIEGLTPLEKLVLLKLADVAGDDTGTVLVPAGLHGLARQCGLSRGAFRRALAQLIARGMVVDRGSTLELALEVSCVAG